MPDTSFLKTEGTEIDWSETHPGFAFLRSSGVMGKLIAQTDWSTNALGPVQSWPDSLKTALSLILNSQHPMWIGWGPQMSFLYNDAYLSVLGLAKHPWALGRPAAEVWSEIWAFCGPLADKVFHAGEASFVDDVRLFMNRGDFLEETFYSFSYSPIRDESGAVGGLFCPSNDITSKVLAARRLRILSELSANALVEKTIAAACATAFLTLEKNPDDIPFALLFLSDGAEPALVQSCGFTGPVPDIAWPLGHSAVHETMRVIEIPDVDGLPTGLAGQPLTRALILPIVPRLGMQSLGSLIIGVNPTAHLDADYRAFFDLIASNIGAAIQNAVSAEAERRRNEALAELDRAKTMFFSNVSHEFRTPLTLLLGPLSELVDTWPDTRDGLNLLMLAQRNALRLQKLANTVLDFVQLEAGRAKVMFVATDLAALTTDLASNFRSACESAGLAFVVDCETLPRPAYVDRAMWEKIVLNLLSNALKFTFSGMITVCLRSEGESVVLTVRDTGVGVAEQEMPRLFERFHRVEGQRRRTHEGSGIGLALVDELVRLHGGSISVESALDTGTAFTVRIPCEPVGCHDELAAYGEANSMPTTAVAEHLAEVEATLGHTGSAFPHVVTDVARPRILLVDDNPDLRAYVTRVLALDHEVVAVGDGVEALEAIARQAFDIVITDIMMPRMDGFALLQAIRSDPKRRALPVLLLSARAGEEATVEGLEHGADDYLLKPFSPAELRARVKAQYQAAQSRRARFLEDLQPNSWFTAASEEKIGATSFRTIVDQLPFIVWLQDAQGSVSFLNSAFYEATHLPRDMDSFTVHGWKRCIHPSDLERNLSTTTDAIEQRAPYKYEQRVKKVDARDDTYRWFAFHAMPQFHEGVFYGWIGVGFDVQAQREIAERNKHIARTLQEGFLPVRFPQDDRLQIDAIYRAADAEALVGGDWYDARQLDNNCFLFSVGDVTGHGIEAASISARLRHAILDFSSERDDPAEIIRCVNRVLHREHEDTYATAIVAIMNLERFTLTYASAGHPPPLLGTNAELPALELPKGGLPLGVEAEIDVEPITIALPPEFTLALFTDGITEFARDSAAAESLLRQEVAGVLASQPQERPATQIYQAVLQNAINTDDVALLFVRSSARTRRREAEMPSAWRFDSRDACAARRCRVEMVSRLRMITSDADALFSAELLLGEAIANVVRHAPGIVDVQLDCSATEPVLTVTDSGAIGKACTAQPVDILRESGRGIFLIDALSKHFEAAPQAGNGTQVRIALAIDSGP